MRTTAALRRLADGLLGVAWAPCCAACDAVLPRPTAAVVCADCWRRVARIRPPLCDVCGAPLAAAPPPRGAASPCRLCPAGHLRPRPVARCRAAGWYDGALGAIIQAFKYQGRQSLAAPLAALMREAGGELLDAADLVVPVPLHPRRRWERGFNQSRDLAARLGPPLADILVRIRHTPPQAALAAGRRQANVRGAFELTGRAWLQARATVAGKTVVVADDVLTTGATLAACARVLRAAGAREVAGLTAARVADRPPRQAPPPRRVRGAPRPPSARRAAAPGAGSSP